MNNPMHRFAASVLAICLAFCAIPVFSATVTAPNNPPDLGTIPPDLSPSVDPNIVVTFDDSGSMVWTHMGDDRPYDGGTWDGPWRCANVIDPRSTKVSDPWSRAMNGVYYNPNIKYTSPLKEDGSSFDPADATLTRVPVDGIYIKRPTNPGSIGTAAYYNNPDGDSNSDDNSATNLMGKYTVTNQKKTTTYYGGSCPGNEDTGSCSLLIAAGTNSTGCPKDPDGNNAYNCQQKELCTAYRSNGDCKSGGHYSPRRYTYTWSDTYQWAITTITTTTTDDRWMCGAGGTSGTSGDSRWKASRSVQNPFDGSVADPDTGATPNGGPVYWRFKQSAQSALTVDSSTGKFTASALTALYNADNWEAVAVPSDQYQNFANWYAYYRYRNVMARTAMSRVFGVLGTPTSSNIRVLWQNLNDSTYGGGSSSKTGLNGVAISTLDDRAGNNDPYGSGTAYRKAFFDWIYQTPASGSTPSRFAAIRAGNFFSQSTVTSGATDPYWQEGTAGNKGQELACRQNFHLLMTDGLYNSKSKPTVVTDPSNTSDDVNPLGPPPDAAKWKGQNKYTASSSGADPTTIFYGGADKDGGDTYSNIAFYYWARNLRPDLAKRDPNDGGNDGVPAYYPDQTTGVTGDVAPVDANNPGATPEVFWNPNNDPATWPHLVQFAVSLGAFGDLTYSDDLDCNKDDGFGIGNNDACKLRKGVKNSSGQIGWPQPNGDAYSGSGIPANIDDLWHAALNSRGAFFVATDPSSLVQHLSDIIQSVLARAQTSTSEAVSSNILPASGTTLGYAGGYDSGNWYGYVYQYTLDAETGIAKEANWDAGCILTGGSFSKIAPTSTTPPRGSCKVTSPPPAPPSRFIFTSINSGGTLVGAPFQWSDLGTAEQTMLNLDPRTTDVDPTTGQVITTPTANAPALDDGNGSDRVKYLRGLRDNETAPTTEASPRQFRIRQSLLGPIVNSQVIYEGAPSSGLSDIFPAGSEEEKAARPCIDGGVCKSYEQFVKQYIDRTPLIYVGGNDGMLHAFDASSGEEQWAYVPNMLYGNGQLDQLTNPKSGLVTTVDDTPIISDMFLKGEWHSILIGSMRLGGRGIYALDITKTDPSTDKFMWEFTSANDPDLGYTYASANTARLHNGKWVVLLASGYFPQKLQVNSATYGTNGTVSTAPGATANVTHLWVLDASDGTVIRKFDTPTGTTSYGMSTPGVIDYGLDQIDDIAVAGDLAGNLWRFDLTDKEPANWTVKAMFQTYDNNAPCSSLNKTGYGCEPISVQPVAFPDPETGGVILVFGSGEYLGPNDRTADSVKGTNHFFGVRDFDVSSTPKHESDLVTQTLSQIGESRFISDNKVPKANAGWMIPLNVAGVNGERDVVTVTPIYAANVAVLTSLIPGSNNDPCKPGRQGAVMAVDAATGGPLTKPDKEGGSVKVGSLVDNPPAVGGVSVLGRVGGGYVVPGVGVIGTGTNGSLDLDFARIWRRTSWRQLLDNL